MEVDYVDEKTKQVITVGGVYGSEKPEVSVSDLGGLPDLPIKTLANTKYEVVIPFGKIVKLLVKSGSRNKFLEIDRTKLPLAGIFSFTGNILEIKSITGGHPPYSVAFRIG
ncbi:MAG: hypothetical protein IPM82_07435 [Saprospiraceae bacterium]|nr:hypothetical protein [Saprospiraceae bacterium]